MFEDFADRLRAVRARIARAAERTGREGRDVTLVAVTKSHPVEAMLTAIAHGVVDLGENRVQEALPKLDRLGDRTHVHLIGRLQTNKVNKAVGRFASIMTVDRDDLLERLAHRAQELDLVQPMWVQVNASDEEQKGGCVPEHAARLWERALAARSLQPVGLMTMARYGAPEPELRRTFARLREIARDLGPASGLDRVELSMGMSDDDEIAEEEGATFVRVGTALFGERETPRG
jgi:PLP dependent protein